MKRSMLKLKCRDTSKTLSCVEKQRWSDAVEENDNSSDHQPDGLMI